MSNVIGLITSHCFPCSGGCSQHPHSIIAATASFWCAPLPHINFTLVCLEGNWFTCVVAYEGVFGEKEEGVDEDGEEGEDEFEIEDDDATQNAVIQNRYLSLIEALSKQVGDFYDYELLKFFQCV